MKTITAKEILEVLDGREPTTLVSECAQRRIAELEAESRACEDDDPWEVARSEWLDDVVTSECNERLPGPKDLIRVACFLRKLGGRLPEDDQRKLFYWLLAEELEAIAERCSASVKKGAETLLEMMRAKEAAERDREAGRP